MEAKHKEFKPFDRIIAREGDGNWICDLYSHYNSKTNSHVTIGFCDLEDNCILPYEGNEHLVGTTNVPGEEVKLEEDEWIMVCDTMERPCWNLRVFSGSILSSTFKAYRYKKHMRLPSECTLNWRYCVRFSDFNPNDMEETEKHILCVRNGKIVKYKND